MAVNPPLDKSLTIKLRCPEFLSKPRAQIVIASDPAWLTLPLPSEPSNNPVYKNEGRVKKRKFFHTTFFVIAA
ncbi:hypothetical protein ACKX2L_09200 [Lachnospiraceae bacterium YH-ros2228]